MQRDERILYGGWLVAVGSLMAGLIANAPKEDQDELTKAQNIVTSVMERQMIEIGRTAVKATTEEEKG